jgi:hypothetical protein
MASEALKLSLPSCLTLWLEWPLRLQLLSVVSRCELFRGSHSLESGPGD